jgi:hypothetical protein
VQLSNRILLCQPFPPGIFIERSQRGYLTIQGSGFYPGLCFLNGSQPTSYMMMGNRGDLGHALIDSQQIVAKLYEVRLIREDGMR